MLIQGGGGVKDFNPERKWKRCLKQEGMPNNANGMNDAFSSTVLGMDTTCGDEHHE